MAHHHPSTTEPCGSTAAHAQDGGVWQPGAMLRIPWHPRAQPVGARLRMGECR